MKQISIIGAGIAGLLPAYFLAKQGHSVTVWEQESYAALKCSYANGGQLSVSNSEVWTTWPNIWKGLKWMGKKDAPLLIRPSLDFDKAIWLAKFLYHTAKNDHARRTAETIRMGIESRKIFHDIIREENIEFDHSPSGILHFYKTPEALAASQQIGQVYQDNGCSWQMLSPRQVMDLEPALKYSKNILGGAYTPEDEVGDIHKFCTQLAYILENKYKVTFIYNWNVADIDTFSDDYVVVAAGVQSVKLAKSIGDRLPIYPVKGYSITIPAADIKSFEAMPSVSILDDEAKIVTSKLGSRLRVAGTAEFDGENYDIRHDRVQPLLNWVENNFPKIDRRNYSSWACLRPMTPNMMPIVAQSPRNKQIFYHTGHGHLGWTLSPLTAHTLASTINKCA